MANPYAQMQENAVYPNGKPKPPPARPLLANGDPATGVVLPGQRPGVPNIFGAVAAGLQQARDTQNALVPDNYGATLRELARARTQRMMRDTNGQSGSLLGVT